jgi:glycopeptide antibiotics resistance protein
VAIYFEGIISLGAFLIWLILALLLKVRFKKTYTYLFFFTIFYVYICNVISYTQFPIFINEQMKQDIGQNVCRDANFIPLNPSHFVLATSLLNVLLTIPFGFGLPFIAKANLKKMMMLGLLLGVCLETLQLIVALLVGFTFRYVDINDVLFNFTGVMIGYLMFMILIPVYRFIIRKYNIKMNGFLSYIYNVQS